MLSQRKRLRVVKKVYHRAHLNGTCAINYLLRVLGAAAPAGVFLGGLIFASTAAAFPDKPIHFIVPYPEGGSSDVVARALAPRLAHVWAQPVIVENIPGGGTVFGTEHASKAAPDGHTLLAGNAALAINEVLSKKLPYHALHDFTPISLAAKQHIAVVVHASSPFMTMRQLSQAAHIKSSQVTYGSAGHGAVGHLAGELFKLMTLSNLTHVAHNGTRQAVTELLANHVSCAIVALPAVIPEVKSGKLRVLAVTDAKRAEILPNVPTVAETVPGYEIDNWLGVLAPYGLSVRLVRRINADIVKIVTSTEFKDELMSLGYQASASTPGEFQTRLAADIERYSGIIAAVGIAGH